MFLSIIVPVFNTEPYLPRSIDSLLNQKMDDLYEIILVNDASTDNSLSVLETYKNKYPTKIVLINSDKNKKAGGARNLGLKCASGKYIGFVDSDDWISPHMFPLLCAEAKRGNYDIVDCNYSMVNEQGKIIKQEDSNCHNQIGDLDQLKKKSLVLRPGRLVTKIFKKELFDKNNLRFVENLFYEDNDLAPALMLQAESLGKVNQYLYYYYIANIDSATKTHNSYHHFDRLKTSISMLQRFRDLGLYDEYKEEIDYRFIYLYYLNTISICLSKFDKPEIQYLKIIKGYVKKHLPNYRKNKYFKECTSFKQKVTSKINDLSPRLLAVIYKVIK